MHMPPPTPHTHMQVVLRDGGSAAATRQLATQLNQVGGWLGLRGGMGSTPGRQGGGGGGADGGAKPNTEGAGHPE